MARGVRTSLPGEELVFEIAIHISCWKRDIIKETLYVAFYKNTEYENRSAKTTTNEQTIVKTTQLTELFSTCEGSQSELLNTLGSVGHEDKDVGCGCG